MLSKLACMPVRFITLAAAASFVLLSASRALAQDFGAAGDFAISVERIFAINGSKVHEENWVDGEPDYEDTYTGISIGWRGPSGNSLGGAPQASSNPFDMPRLAFDYFVIDRLSVGGSLGYATNNDGDDAPEAFGADSTSALLFSPRAGYAFMFSEAVGFWPQGGFSYYSTTHDESHTEKGLSFTLNLPLLFSPVNHLAFMAGPYVDLGLWGTIDYDGGLGGPPPPDHDRTYRSIGLAFGLLGWL